MFINCFEQQFEKQVSERMISILQIIQAIFDFAGLFCCGESAENPVPERKDISVITVGLDLVFRVMYFVHIGRYKYKLGESFNFRADFDIGMFELGVKSRKRCANQTDPERKPEQNHAAHVKREAKERFDRVLAEGGRHVNHRVRVMNTVKTPQPTDFMKQDVR